MKSTVFTYDAIFEEQSVGGYTVTVPALPGCISEGDTFEDARKNISDAVELYLEDLAADNQKLPKENNGLFIGSIKVKLNLPFALS